jgi:antitoxin (DNA-binding transcriptional repressor) of toxin-antitoxin stability system
MSEGAATPGTGWPRHGPAPAKARPAPEAWQGPEARRAPEAWQAGNARRAGEAPLEADARWAPGVWRAPDARRRLQLGLAAFWLLDAVLQAQAVMFTKAFGQMLAEAARGNPAVIATPGRWAAHIVGHYPTATNASFVAVQLLLGLGIIWRPTVKLALAASIGWSAAVWLFGEGLGGVLSGSASPPGDPPGAVVIYALLAVLLWPSGPADRPAPFVAARAVGAATARSLWLLLWAGMGYFAVQPAAQRAPQALHDMISEAAAGEPGWLAAIDHTVAGLLAHRGLPASVILATAFALIATGIFLPAAAARVTVALAALTACAVWVIGQNLGGLLAGSATDPDSGPLLVLLAAAYWPARRLSPLQTGPRVPGDPSRQAPDR